MNLWNTYLQNFNDGMCNLYQMNLRLIKLIECLFYLYFYFQINSERKLILVLIKTHKTQFCKDRLLYTLIQCSFVQRKKNSISSKPF